MVFQIKIENEVPMETLTQPTDENQDGFSEGEIHSDGEEWLPSNRGQEESDSEVEPMQSIEEDSKGLSFVKL